MAAGIVAALLTATITQMISCSSYEISQLLDLHYRPPLLRDRAHGCSSNTLPFVKKTSHVLAPFCFPSPVWRGVLRKLQSCCQPAGANNWCRFKRVETSAVREAETGGGGNLRRSLGEHQGRLMRLRREFIRPTAYFSVTFCLFWIYDFGFLPVLVHSIVQTVFIHNR